MNEVEGRKTLMRVEVALIAVPKRQWASAFCHSLFVEASPRQEAESLFQ